MEIFQQAAEWAADGLFSDEDLAQAKLVSLGQVSCPFSPTLRLSLFLLWHCLSSHSPSSPFPWLKIKQVFVFLDRAVHFLGIMLLGTP